MVSRYPDPLWPIIQAARLYRWDSVRERLHVWNGSRYINVYRHDGEEVDCYCKGEWFAVETVSKESAAAYIEARIKADRRESGYRPGRGRSAFGRASEESMYWDAEGGF